MIVVLNDARDLMLVNISNDRHSWFTPAASMNVSSDIHSLINQQMSDVKLFTIAHLTLRVTSPWMGILVAIPHLPILVNDEVGYF